MENQMIFSRYEVKYLISTMQMQKLKQLLWQNMVPDAYGRSLIQSIYFDTPDYRLIGHSMEHPVYKEKLRLRSYGIAGNDTTVFLELKKKYDDIVYKRRIAMSMEEARPFLKNGILKDESQIGQELAYAFAYYPSLKPRVLIQCQREAYYGKTNPNLRLTFDEEICWRDYQMSLSAGAFGEKILPKGKVLLEVKTDGSIPLWLVDFFTKEQIYKTTFSKYGNAYSRMQEKGVRNYA